MTNRYGKQDYADVDQATKSEDLYSTIKKEYSGMEPPSSGMNKFEETKPQSVIDSIDHYGLLIISGIARWFSCAERFVVPGKALTEGQTVRQRKIIGGWLLCCAAMLFGAVTLGGVTRLMGSSSTIINGNPIMGMRPSLTEIEWQLEFSKYKLYPEYKSKTYHGEMTLERFKFMWSMEYVHRLWSRAIALVFLIPCGYFWARGRFTAPMTKLMVIAGALLIGQGLMSWWMGKSELHPSQNYRSDVSRASQYRRVAHLLSAFVLYVIYIWTGLAHVITPDNHTNVPKIDRLRSLALATKAVILSAAVNGAFVVGFRGGYVCNTWPTYDGKLIPDGMLAMEPIWRNFFENPVTLQFLHRFWAYLIVALVTATWLVGRRMALSPRARMALHGLMILGCTQLVVGIIMLINYVPIWLGALHQSGIVPLITFASWLTCELGSVSK